jgi:hypothetical protein
MFYIYTGENENVILAKAREYAHSRATAQDIIEVTNEYYNAKKESNQILVETVRKARYDVYIKPYGDRKVIIFPNADSINISGQNVLLKVLEEPPEYADFILISKNPHMLLATVRSRAQVVRVSDNTENVEEGELFVQLDTLIGTKSDALYRVIEWFLTKKDEKNDIFARCVMYFNKKMLSELQKGDKILAERYATCALRCEEAQKRLSANANFSMTVNKTLLAVREDINING